MKKYFFVFCLIFVISTSSGINGQETLLVIKKEYLPYPDTTLIFQPEGINEPENLPLVILLHGWSGNYKQWSEIADLQYLSSKYGFVIATPEGFYDSWYVDNTARENYRLETFIVNDLIPLLIEKYKIDKSKIFISGLSMGGHGAITLFLKHPDLFLSAGSTSGILDITAFPGKWGLASALGSYVNHKELWENNSAFFLLDNFREKNKQLIVDCGTEDFAFPVNHKFFHKCKKSGIKITFIARPGKHERTYWAKSLIYHLNFFKNILTGNN